MLPKIRERAVQLTFGQKLLTAFGILLVLIMGAFTIAGDVRLQNTTNTYIDALIKDAVVQNTTSITEWLNTRLAMTEAAAERIRNVSGDEQARGTLQVVAAGGEGLARFLSALTMAG